MIINNSFCSPVNDKNKLCFTTASMTKMVNIWNSFNKHKIYAKNANQIYTEFNNMFKEICGNNSYWLWCGLIEKMADFKLSSATNISNYNKLMKIKRDLRLIAKKNLRPEKPESWYKNPKEWLSNYDIQNVMIQYAQCKKYKYDFLGVFPIDFSVASVNGVCLYSEFCSIDVLKYIKKGKKFIGLITNLDKHDEAGSHWTSTFIVIDPTLQTYGAYYYDSTGHTIPSYLNNFLLGIKAQCDKLFPNKEFKINLNKKQHQRKNTECGVFSMVFQIRWINKHIVKKNNTSFEEIISGNPFIDDDHMIKVRDVLFRPNTKMELKKIFSISKNKKQ